MTFALLGILLGALLASCYWGPRLVVMEDQFKQEADRASRALTASDAWYVKYMETLREMERLKPKPRKNAPKSGRLR